MAMGKFFPSSYMGYQNLTKSITMELLENPLFNTPLDISILKYSATNRVSFVVDQGWHRIIYSKDNADWIKAWGEYGTGYNNFKNPTSCTIDDLQNLFVADYGNNRIVKLVYVSNEDQLFYRGAYALPNDGRPWDIDYSNGYVYVTDCFNDQILKYDTVGTLYSSYGSQGTGINQFLQPQGLAVLNDTLYIADLDIWIFVF
jgi:DNA-binding beta-propeller fold protein YncE